MEAKHPDSGSRRREIVILAGLLCLALVVRLLFLARYADTALFHVPLGDELNFHLTALGLLGQGAEGQAFLYQPLYSFFLAGVYWIFGVDPALVRTLQVLIGTGSVLVYYGLGRELHGPWAGRLCAAVAALFGPLIFFEGHLLAPGLISPLLAGALWCLLAAGKRSRPLLVLPAGLLMGLSMMGRPNLALLLPVGFIWLLMRFKAWKARALVAGLAGLGLLAGFAPSTIHNAMHGGGLSPVSSAGGISFYLGNNPQATGRFHVPRGEHIDASSHASYRQTLASVAERELGRPLTASEVSGYWWSRGFAFWAEQPGAALALTGRKLLLALNSQEQPIHHPFDFGRELAPVLRFCLPFGVLFAFAVVGGVFGRRRLTGVGLLSLCSGVYLLSLVVFYVADRYRVALLPMLAPLFACGVLTLAERFRQGGFGRIAPALGVLAVAFGLTQLPMTSQAERDRILSAGWGRLGVAAGQLGDLDQAQQAFERAVELAGPGRAATARMNLGVVYLKRKRFVDAARLFSEAAAVEPERSKPWAQLARLAERQGQLELAISHWAQAAKRMLDPSSAQNQIQRLRLLLAMRQPAEPDPGAP